MAVLAALPGVKVTIESKGQPLTEIVDDDAGDRDSWVANYGKTCSSVRQVSTFVESQADTDFRIRIDMSHSPEPSIQGLNTEFNKFAFWASVDGKEIGGQMIDRDGRWPVKRLVDRTTEWISKTHVSSRTLKFGAILKVDSLDAQQVEQHAKSVRSLGEIVVFMYKTQEMVDSNPVDLSTTLNKPVTEIAEKVLKGKAVSLGVAFGEATTKPHARMACGYPDGEKNPMGAFRFKYRSRADLQSELILPRSESPDAVPTPLAERGQRATNIEVPSARERRLAELKKEIAEIKAEPVQGTSNQRCRGHKREHSLNNEILHSSRIFKSFKTDDGNTVVDLTDD